MINRLRPFAPTAAVVFLLAVPAAASAATASPTPSASSSATGVTFASVQAKVPYTVYVPTVTLKEKLTKLQTYPCSVGAMGSTADYSGPRAGRHFSINQSQKGCQDGPSGVGVVTTVKVKGAKATIMGKCAKGPGSMSGCKSATRAGLLKAGYSTVMMPAPAGKAGSKTTFVEIYSTGLNVAKVTALLKGLRPVG